MIIKVCGVRDPENFREVCKLDVDWVGLNFCAKSPRYVAQISSRGGFYPDYTSFAEERPAIGKPIANQKHYDLKPQRVGVFVDDMPQTIITRIVNFFLDFVQLHGDENAVMIQNLRRSVEPDIRRGVKIIKAIPIASADDFARCQDYEGVVDYFLFDTKGALPGGNGEKFDWALLDAYKGDTPFLLSGGIGPDDVEALRQITHPKFAGVDVNSQFETEPGVKDIEKLKAFIQALKA